MSNRTKHLAEPRWLIVMSNDDGNVIVLGAPEGYADPAEAERAIPTQLEKHPNE